MSKATFTILEIGANSGVFLSELRDGLEQLFPEISFSLLGIDIDQSAVDRNVDQRNRLICCSAEDYFSIVEERPDMVVHFELIEHLPDPFSFARAVYDFLSPGSLHFFTTPNLNGFDNVALGYNQLRLLAHAIFPPMHVNAFSTTNVGLFAMRAGFDVVEVATPGIFDADILALCKDHLPEGSVFKQLDIDSDYQKAVLQAVIQELNISSHMEVTLRKR